MRRIALAGTFALLIGLMAPASSSSLPAVSVGPRPGPDVLYAPLASAPQLENVGGWSADPLLVSGAAAYVGGELLYQDYVYDDYGANTTDVPLASPDTTPPSSGMTFGAPTGDVVYPTDAPTYGHNAADLLEFRARLLPGGGVAYRVTLNTMLAADVAGVAIGIDADGDPSTGSDDWGYGLGSLGPLGVEHVVVSWGAGAEADGTPVTSGVDVGRNQIEIAVPSSVLAPAGATWRHYVAVGLFDPQGKAFVPVADQPTPTEPGGAHGTVPPPVFNVGFRLEVEGDEPMGSDNLDDPGTNAGEPGPRGAAGFGHWREHAQAKALAARDISAFSLDVDFGKLAAGTDDDALVPATGYMNRLYASHLDLGEGATGVRPMLLGKIQPYSVYVPTTYQAGTPAPLTIVLHSLSSSYNQYAVYMPRMLEQLGEERGAFVLTTEGRGPNGWYHDEAEYDLFEAWADLAARYDLDPDRVTVSGYSMGGYGTYKMASQYPDLFARGFAIVGPADESIFGGPTGGAIEDDQNTLHIADNLLNVPLLMWNGAIDELVPLAGVLRYEQRLYDLGYRHELDVFPTHDHFLFAVVDRWGPGRDFLGTATVDRNPDRVVYRAFPEMDNATLGLVHDHAYWVSDIAVAAGARSGLVDAHSLASGGIAVTTADVLGPGTDPTPHAKRGLSWTASAAGAPENTLEISLTDVASATLWIERAGIDTTATITLEVDSNGAATIVLAGSFGTHALAVPAGASTHTVDL